MNHLLAKCTVLMGFQMKSLDYGYCYRKQHLICLVIQTFKGRLLKEPPQSKLVTIF